MADLLCVVASQMLVVCLLALAFSGTLQHQGCSVSLSRGIITRLLRRIIQRWLQTPHCQLHVRTKV